VDKKKISALSVNRNRISIVKEISKGKAIHVAGREDP
jgi:hypothetical protein